MTIEELRAAGWEVVSPGVSKLISIESLRVGYLGMPLEDLGNATFVCKTCTLKSRPGDRRQFATEDECMICWSRPAGGGDVTPAAGADALRATPPVGDPAFYVSGEAMTTGGPKRVSTDGPTHEWETGVIGPSFGPMWPHMPKHD